MIGTKRRKLGFVLTGLMAAAVAALGGAAVVLKSTPAAACWASAAGVPNCDTCYVDGGSSGKDNCDMLYGAGRGYCEANGGDCYSD
jgi:hypothetical protein